MHFTTFFNVNLWQMRENYTRVNTLKLGKLFHIKNKTKLMKLCKFIRVIQYHSSPPWLTTYLSVIQIKRCYFISIIIIIQFCRPSFLTFETDQFLFFFLAMWDFLILHQCKTKKITCVLFNGKCMLYSLCQLPPNSPCFSFLK